MVAVIKKPLSVMPEGFVWLKMSAQTMCLTLSALHDCSFTGLSAWDCQETFRTLMRSAPIPPLLVFSCASAIFRPNPPLASKPCFAKFRVLSDPLVSHEIPPVPYRTTRIHLQTRSGCQARPRHSTHTRHNTRCCLSVPVPPLPGEQVGSTLLSNAPTLLPTRCHPRSSAVSASRVRSQLLRGATPASSTTQAWVCDPTHLAAVSAARGSKAARLLPVRFVAA